MGLATGTKLGPYEINGQLGAGGMGEVYRARDARLGRDVAIKVLPQSFAADPDRLRRFEQEARVTGSLNHPNILAVYDIGTLNGSPYLVSELLEGDTLRDHMSGSALPQRKAIDYGTQIARGLAAAHEKGVVHRDLKPENIFVLRDGRLKILDFGLAKTIRSEAMAAGSAPTLAEDQHAEATTPGQVLGTVGYMSPEQVKGKVADHRSDIFTFGTILYEMLSGQRASKRDSSVETMSAILKEDPPELTETARNIPPGLERVVRHCLEKAPEQRFQSVSDIAFDLEMISGQGSATSKLVAVKESKQRRFYVGGIIAAAAVLAFGLGYLLGHRTQNYLSPRFRQLTFQRGTIFAANFAPDGQSIIYTAAWNGAPTGDLYTTRTDSIMSRPLNIQDAEVLGISSKGNMAIRLRTSPLYAQPRGTLAVVPITGGAPRELMDDVVQAAWAPDGESLAAVHFADEEYRLEYPFGKVLFSSKAGLMSHIRFSPDGKHIAYFDHPAAIDSRGYVAVTDLQGKTRRLTGEWSDLTGLVWSLDGQEVWFTGSDAGINSKLYAVDLKGNLRNLLHVPGRLKVMDISSSGKVLFTNETNRQEVWGRGPFSEKEVNLSWFDWTLGRSISTDGKWAVLEEDGEGGGPDYSVFLRKTDGSEAIRLGSGWAGDISPDGKWVASGQVQQPAATILLPTGAGQSLTLNDANIEHVPSANAFAPDGKALVVVGSEPNQPVQSYWVPLDGSPAKRVGPPGFRARAISPDSQRLVGKLGNKNLIVPVSGSDPPQELTKLLPNDRIQQWSGDGKYLFSSRPAGLAAEVYKIDIQSGTAQLMFKAAPGDLSGTSGVGGGRLTRDGKYYVFTVARTLSDLYTVENLK